MDIFQKIKEEKNIEQLRAFALKQLQLLYNAILKASYRAEIFEFLLEKSEIKTSFDYFQKPKVSVVIWSKDEFTMTCTLLHSLKKNIKNIEYEVIVADDNTNSKFQNIEKAYKNICRIFKVNESDNAIEYINNAIENAKGEYILILNCDNFLNSDILNKMLKVIENNNSIGIAGAKILQTDDSIDSCGIKILKDYENEYIGNNENKNYLDEKDFVECDFCAGSAILFKRDIWEKVGKFDKNIENTDFNSADFSFKLKYNLGLKSVCIPNVKIYNCKILSDLKNNKTQINEDKEYFISKWKKYLSL